MTTKVKERVSGADSRKRAIDVADAIVLKWWGVYGSKETDSKAYRELVSAVEGALANQVTKPSTDFQTSIEYLEDAKRPMLRRTEAILKNSRIVAHTRHQCELAELGRQITEIDQAIAILNN